MDKFSKKKRSEIMSKIKGKDTWLEIFLKSILLGSYLRYHPRILGNPDFGSKSKRIAIFVDGCFWHGCPKHYKRPKSNCVYWTKKLAVNRKRDRKISKKLGKMGYRTIRVWEDNIFNEKSISKLLSKVFC